MPFLEKHSHDMTSTLLLPVFYSWFQPIHVPSGCSFTRSPSGLHDRSSHANQLISPAQNPHERRFTIRLNSTPVSGLQKAAGTIKYLMHWERAQSRNPPMHDSVGCDLPSSRTCLLVGIVQCDCVANGHRPSWFRTYSYVCIRFEFVLRQC